jgi:hypothetical protein
MEPRDDDAPADALAGRDQPVTAIEGIENCTAIRGSGRRKFA